VKRSLIYGVVVLICWCAVPSVMGKTKLPKTVVRSWQLPHPLDIADTVKVDSAFLNFAMRNELYDLSICNLYNGNLVSPVMSAIYFNRTHKTDFLFGDQYDIYTPTPQDVRFYNTTTPYSYISYKRGFKTYHEDDELKFMFTGNITPKWNIGTTLNYTNAVGHYKSQAGKTFNGTAFTSYNGNHYSLQAAFTFNRLSSFENGGLADPTQISDNELRTEDIATNLEAMSGYRYLSGYLNHYYSVCVEKQDSIRTIYVPVMTFRHVFETSEQVRRYVEHTYQSFYPLHYRNLAATNDSAATLTIRNTLSATFEEAFNRKLKFGVTVFATDEAQRFLNGGWDRRDYNTPQSDYNQYLSQSIVPMADSIYNYTWTNNVMVGGEMYKKSGKFVYYGFGGEVCLLGWKLGQFDIYGHLDGVFKLGTDTMRLRAEASVKNEVPNYYHLHYNTNHYRWGASDNTYEDVQLDKTYRLHAGGKISYPTKWVKPSLKVDYENISKYIYWEMYTLQPQQMKEGTISIFSGDAEVDITTPWFNLDNHVIYQYSSDKRIALPTVSIYANWYYHGTWFKALDAQIGIDMRYNTAYYAPVWDPALAQFCVQEEEKVGNYPSINVYANFYVRLLHLRFFAQYEHMNTTWMPRYYFSMPGYPTNPDVFRAGLAFHFYK